MSGKAFAVGRRRDVRRVGIVKVQPREEGSGAARAEPFQRRIDDLVGMTLGAGLARNALMEVFVERVEALIEPEGGGHRVRADEGRGPIPLALQQRRDRRVFRAKIEHDVAADAVNRRVLASEDGRVGGTGERHRRLRLVEPHAALRERIERRCCAGRGSVGADVIRAQRIDGDED